MTQLIEAKATEATARRDAHLDLLRLVALIGVIIYQWFGWSWTPIAIPFAALTFTIAGALLAGSLDRSAAPIRGLCWRSGFVALCCRSGAWRLSPFRSWCGTALRPARDLALAVHLTGSRCCCGLSRCSSRRAVPGALHGQAPSGSCRLTYG
jgi:hypothetical protein